MKKILTIAAMAMGAMLVHGQGYVIVQSTAAGVLTNTSSFYSQGTGSPVSGKTGTAASSYYYALLFDASALTGATGPNNAGWTLATQNGGAALAINNYILAGAITGTGTSAGVQVNMAAGTTYNVELVGWSASLGTTFAQVLSQYTSGNWIANGFFNYTSVGTMTPFATAGAGDPTIFPGTFSNGSFSLYAVSPVPEPGTIALAALGGASLLLFRRKK